MKRGNCWIYALPRWFKGYRAGKYLIVRKSVHTFWPHVMLADSIAGVLVEEFTPIAPLKGWRVALQALWFKGRVKKGRVKGSLKKETAEGGAVD